MIIYVEISISPSKKDGGKQYEKFKICTMLRAVFHI